MNAGGAPDLGDGEGREEQHERAAQEDHVAEAAGSDIRATRQIRRRWQRLQKSTPPSTHIHKQTRGPDGPVNVSGPAFAPPKHVNKAACSARISTRERRPILNPAAFDPPGSAASSDANDASRCPPFRPAPLLASNPSPSVREAVCSAWISTTRRRPSVNPSAFDPPWSAASNGANDASPQPNLIASPDAPQRTSSSSWNGVASERSGRPSAAAMFGMF